jgi:hypothetical protein
MASTVANVSASALTSLFVFGAMSAATLPSDLSAYRKFQFGSDLQTVAKLAGSNPSHATVIHRRPALIEELEWRPQPLGWSSKTEPVQQVVFSFYNGELFRIVATYDRYETEGLTSGDIIDAVSATYGTPTKAAVPEVSKEFSGDKEEILAQWEDPLYRFDLVRFSYGTTFRLIGVMKKLEAPAQAAIIEAKRLDDKEAPQRDAARLASEEQAAGAKLEKARLANKPKFRP